MCMWCHTHWKAVIKHFHTTIECSPTSQSGLCRRTRCRAMHYDSLLVGGPISTCMWCHTHWKAVIKHFHTTIECSPCCLNWALLVANGVLLYNLCIWFQVRRLIFTVIFLSFDYLTYFHHTSWLYLTVRKSVHVSTSFPWNKHSVTCACN